MSGLNDHLRSELTATQQAGLLRTLPVIDSPQGPRITIEGRDLLNFASNDYLGLANDPRLRAAAIDGTERYGVGSGASRLVTGNLEPYAALEKRLAAFKHQPAALVFGSGYAANLGTITALVGTGDLVILDKLDHASIVDGARLSGATIRVYPHRDMRKLERILAGPTAAKASRILVVTETIFSMDGDRAPLEEIVELKDRYGAWLMIDEAHATGLYGDQRSGLVEELGVAGQIDVTLGTLSKALGCAGGFVCGSQDLVDFLVNRARSLIYSTALPPGTCAAAAAAVDLVASEDGKQRCDRLWQNVSLLKQGLAARDWDTASDSPILPLIVGPEETAVRLSRELREKGVFVPAIRYPTVARGKARLRVTVSASHAAGDIETFLAAIGPKP